MAKIITVISGTCPRCKAASIFRGPIAFKDHCPECGLHIADMDLGDGPAFFMILFLGLIIGALATYIELAYEPPFWVHAVIHIPTTLALCIIGLRWTRAALLWFIYSKEDKYHGDA